MRRIGCYELLLRAARGQGIQAAGRVDVRGDPPRDRSGRGLHRGRARRQRRRGPPQRAHELGARVRARAHARRAGSLVDASRRSRGMSRMCSPRCSPRCWSLLRPTPLDRRLGAPVEPAAVEPAVVEPAVVEPPAAEPAQSPGTLTLAPREPGEYQLFDGEGRPLGPPMRAGEGQNPEIQLPTGIYYVRGPSGMTPVVVASSMEFVWGRRARVHGRRVERRARSQTGAR